jgi:hypothetical protein
MEGKMQAKLTTKPVQDVVAAIHALNLDSVKIRLMDAELGEGWSREYADSIEAAYRNYLTMLVKYPADAEDILLSEDVDEFWHTHILQTIKYAADCENVFGNFLHHTPHVGEVTQADLEKREALAEKTRHLYEREFGGVEHAETAWSGSSPRNATAAYSGATIQAQSAAYSGTTIRSQSAAYSGAAIRAEQAAYSGATIKAQKAAYSGASIKTERAAYSGASIRAGSAAYSGATIRIARTESEPMPA